MPFHQVSQQHDLTIRKFQRIVMGVRAVYIDLPERSRFCVPRIVSFTGPTERLFKNVNFNRLLSPIRLRWVTSDADRPHTLVSRSR